MPRATTARGLEDVGAEIDELYANAPGAFTKKRDELAKRLKAERRGDVAATVKALRKPTQIAYVLNLVARRFTDEVGELVDVGRDLSRAQRKALRGGDASGELRTAIGRQRHVVRDLTTKTGALMREIGVSATGHLDEIAGALQAALVDPIIGAQLEEGRLEKVPERATGFPGAAPRIEPVPERRREREREIPPPPKSAPRKKPARESKRARQEAARAAKAAALAERQRVTLEKARGAWDEAKAQAELLATRAEAERTRADKLLEAALEAAAEAKRLAKEATEAESDATKTEKGAKAAEREVKRLATKARRG